MVSVENIEYAQSVVVANVYGLHARPAAEFVKLAGKFESKILVSKDGLEVNGKSIMGVMMLAAERGSTIEIKACGNDAKEAVDALVNLVADGFGEE
jgi:phosphocarrier protein